MKKFTVILCIFILALIFHSCKNEALLNGDGKWSGENINYIGYVDEKDSMLYLDWNERNITYSFAKDGGGYRKSSNGVVFTFTWEKIGKEIFISENEIGESPKKYTIRLDKSNAQEWTRRDTVENKITLYKVILYK